MLKQKLIFLLSIFLLLATGCAKRGTITGGAKDTIPPVLISSHPKNFNTNFKGDFIKISFNEYIKVKDISKQLIISPPMKNAPFISPMGSASKFITIKINDTLQPNTTYSFNFGQSISDNNEGNPYSQFKYVFSTGSHIDSLKAGGMVKDALSQKTDNFINIQLYEAETFKDSTLYKEQPRYVTNTLDSTTSFKLENLKEGKYYLIALKDQNNDYKFNPKTDKIAFLKEPITVPGDSQYQLQLFKETVPFKAEKPSQGGSSKLLMGFEGNPKNTQVTLKNKGVVVPSAVSKFTKGDSLQIWFPKIKTDSLQIEVNNGKFNKTFVSRIKEMKPTDSLTFKTKQSGVLHFRDSFGIRSSIPLTRIDNSKISIFKKDSSAVTFTTKYDELEQEVVFDFKKDEEEKYRIKVLPGAFKDFYEKENDSLNYTITTKKLSDYGVMKLTLQNVKRFPILVELLDDKENVVASHYSEQETVVNFEALEPRRYTLRVVYDDDKNKEWTTGNFLEKREAEEVVYYPEVINVLANWYLDESFILSK
ncbi:Ig-like domain-containing protein [Flavobacterium pedocola]